MNNMYYYEVPFEVKCEKCGKKYHGIIKRGPLQIGGSVLSTGLQAGVNSAEMKLSKKLIEGDLENGTHKYFSVEKSAKCPHCDSMQSWYPLNPPSKPSHIGVYIITLITFPLLAMLIWAIFFFDDVIPFAILMSLAVILALFVSIRSSKKHKEEEKELFKKLTKEYENYLSDMEKIKDHNKPEINFKEAKHIPLK